MLQIRNKKDILYPQHEDNFLNTLTTEQWQEIQSEAEDNLEKDTTNVAPRVVEHWISIKEGRLPFGFQIKDSE